MIGELIMLAAFSIVFWTLINYLWSPGKRRPKRQKPRKSQYQERWNREVGRSFNVFVEFRDRNVREIIQAQDEQEARMNILNKYPYALRMWVQEIE